MFNLFGKKQPTQSQSIGHVTGQVQVTQTQTGGDAQVITSQTNQVARQGLSGAEVVALLAQLQEAIAASALTDAQKEELQDYLKPTQREAGKENPDKALMGKNLQQVSATMKQLKETTEAGKTLWQTGVEVLKVVGPWVGLAAGWLG